MESWRHCVYEDGYCKKGVWCRCFVAGSSSDAASGGWNAGGKEDGTCEKKVKIGEQFRGLYGITTYFKDGTSKELITLDFSK